MARALVAVANLGSPDAPTAEAVRAFLASFLADPDVVDWPRWLWRPLLHGLVLRRRPARVAALYASVWTPEGSPLAAGTRRVAAALSRELGADFDVRPCHRHGAPSLAAEIARAGAEGARSALVLPLFPQRTASSLGSIERESARAARAAGLGLRRVALDPGHPGYVAALAERCRTALAAAPHAPAHLVVSFHGIPARVDRRERETYSRDCRRTTELLLAALGWPAERATLAFQSRFGPERWLGPATAVCLAALPRRGVRDVLVVAPGFLTDGLETLEELDLRGRATFLAAGGRTFVRAAAVADHPATVSALADAVRAADRAPAAMTRP